VGVEPTTCRLRIGCSTTELPRPFIIQDLFPCQSYFRTASIKLPSNCCPHWSRNRHCDRPTHDLLSSARRERLRDIPTGDPRDSLEKRPLLFVDYPKGSGGATETRNHTQISLSLSHSFRKFLVLQGCASWKWYLADFLFLWRCSERMYTYRLDTVQREEMLCRTT
jgi:hypothetical protein